MVTMDDVDRAHIDANTAQIDFLTEIIKANKLHEPQCLAFSLPKDHSGPFGFATSMLDGQCHCWLDQDNRAEDGKGFAYYHMKDEKLAPIGYVNRYGAVTTLLEDHPELSSDKSSENYWNKAYAIVEVITSPIESAK